MRHENPPTSRRQSGSSSKSLAFWGKSRETSIFAVLISEPKSKFVVKSLPLVLSGLAFLGVIVLFGMRFSGDTTSETDTPADETRADTTASASQLPIAIINQDTLNLYYDFIEDARQELLDAENRQRRQLQSKQARFQKDVQSFQNQMQAGLLSQNKAQALQQELEQRQQDLMMEAQTLERGLLERQKTLQDTLYQKVDKFLTRFNEDKAYAYIFMYSEGGMFWYDKANAEDITQRVLKGLNKEYAATKPAEEE